MKWFKRVFGGANDPKDRKDTTNPSPTSSLNVVLQRIGQSNVHPVQTGAELLALVPRIEERRERLFRLSQVDAQLFAQAYWTALESFAEVVQMLPASERHHHSHALGQLEHTIEAVEQAMLRRRSMLLPMGAEPEREARERYCWTYAVFVSALCHDVGKPYARFALQARVKGVFRPFPGLGATLVEIGASEYQYTFIDRNYSLHNHVAPLIAGRIIPANGWAWLSLAPDAIAQVSAYLFGDRFACGIVGELAHHGDTTSVAAHMQVQAHPPLIPVQAQAERALRQFATTWVLNSSTGGDAWVKGQYVFVRATVINDLHELLVREQVAQTPSTPALLLTRLADYGLLMAHKIPDGQPKSIFTMRVTAPTGAVVSERFSALVVPASRVFGIGQAKQFGGDIKILLPDLPPEHVLILATSVPSSNPRQEYPIVSPAPSSAPIVTPAPAAPTAMASPAPNPALVAPAPVVSSAPAPVVSSAPAPVVSSVPSPAPAPAVSSAPPFPLASSAPGVIDDDVMALLQSQLSGGMAQLNATGDYIPSNHVDVPPIVTAFVAWAKQGLDGGQITMNAKGALVHGLPDLPRCVGLVSPVSFLQFITATGYVWGEREHIDSGNMDHLGLRATLEQLQQKFRACKWAPQSGADPGKNVFHYQIGENGPTLTLVALSEEGTRALLSAKEWAPNSVLIRRRTHDNSSKAQKPKTKRPLPQQPKGKGGASLIEAKSGSPADRFKG